MIRLYGSPEQIGTTWGRVNKDIIVRDMADTYLRRAQEEGISVKTLIERSAEFRRFALRNAPHWLEEIRATARAACMDEELYLAFWDGQSRNRFLHADDPECGRESHDGEIVDCTSYAVCRNHALHRAIMFHKTRDNVDRPQLAPMVESSVEGINKFIAVTDGSRIRCSMMINDKGLAGAGDYPAAGKKESSTLQLPEAAPRHRGLMAGTILRHIAERAATAPEALAIIQDVVEEGYYGGGAVGGSHWLFVDRDGVILEVCNNARHVVSQVHTGKAYASRFNQQAPIQRLRAAGMVDFAMFRGVSRQQPVLTERSIAGMTVEIDPDYPDLLTVAWIAMPARTAAFPVFMGQRRMPLVLVDGSAYAAGKGSASRGCSWNSQQERWTEMEAQMHADKQKLVARAKASLDAGCSLEGGVESLEHWSYEQAVRNMESRREACAEAHGEAHGENQQNR